MTLLQDDRLIRISTNLGENAFVVLSFIGTEKISGLFSFDLLLASEQNDIRFEQLAGKNATVAIGSSDGDKRFFNGIITGSPPAGLGPERVTANTAPRCNPAPGS